MGALATKYLLPPTPPSYGKELPGLFFIQNEFCKGKIPAVFHEWVGSNGERAHFTLCYSGRHTEDLGQVNTELNVIKETLRVNVIGFDYCGYGLHEVREKITEQTFYNNLEAVIYYLTKTRMIPYTNIILVGKGIGTGPVVQYCSDLYHVAGRNSNQKPRLFKKTNGKKNTPPNPGSGFVEYREVAGLILISPMTSLMALANPGVTEKSNKDAFNNYQKIIYIECPVLITHGNKDQIIPFEHSKKLKNSCINLWRFLEIDDIGHYGVDSDNSFFDTCLLMLKELGPADARNAVVIPKPMPLMYKAPEETIRAWLQPLNLIKYSQNFLMFGYIDMPSLLQVDKTILDEMGITNSREQTIILNDVELRRNLAPLQEYLVAWSEVEPAAIQRRTHFYETYRAEYKGDRVSLTRYFTDPASFMRQAAQLMQFDHPHVLKPRGIIVEDDVTALIFPSCGDSLESLLVSQAKILQLRTDVFKYTLARAIAGALNYLVTRSPPFYHQRLTSRHVLVNERTEIMLSGMSQLINPVDAIYKAPESENSEKTAVYSYGIILYELVNYTAEDDVRSLPSAIANFIAKSPETARKRSKTPQTQNSSTTDNPESTTTTVSNDSISDTPGPTSGQDSDAPVPFANRLLVLLRQCLKTDPKLRPTFAEIVQQLDEIKPPGVGPVNDGEKDESAPIDAESDTKDSKPDKKRRKFVERTPSDMASLSDAEERRGRFAIGSSKKRVPHSEDGIASGHVSLKSDMGLQPGDDSFVTPPKRSARGGSSPKRNTKSMISPPEEREKDRGSIQGDEKKSNKSSLEEKRSGKASNPTSPASSRPGAWVAGVSTHTSGTESPSTSNKEKDSLSVPQARPRDRARSTEIKQNYTELMMEDITENGRVITIVKKFDAAWLNAKLSGTSPPRINAVRKARRGSRSTPTTPRELALVPRDDTSVNYAKPDPQPAPKGNAWLAPSWKRENSITRSKSSNSYPSPVVKHEIDRISKIQKCDTSPLSSARSPKKTVPRTNSDGDHGHVAFGSAPSIITYKETNTEWEPPPKYSIVCPPEEILNQSVKSTTKAEGTSEEFQTRDESYDETLSSEDDSDESNAETEPQPDKATLKRQGSGKTPPTDGAVSGKPFKRDPKRDKKSKSVTLTQKIFKASNEASKPVKRKMSDQSPKKISLTSSPVNSPVNSARKAKQ